MLAYAGRLLEYNESTGRSTAQRGDCTGDTDEKCDVAVSYNGVAIALADKRPLIMPVRELRYNAVSSPCPLLLRGVKRGEIDPPSFGSTKAY
jgi:hypothetical protein